MQLRMYIQVLLAQVPLHQQLVLLRVAAADYEVILACHKPVELFKPGRLAQLLHSRHGLYLRMHTAHFVQNVGLRKAA